MLEKFLQFCRRTSTAPSMSVLRCQLQRARVRHGQTTRAAPPTVSFRTLVSNLQQYAGHLQLPYTTMPSPQLRRVDL